MYQSKDNAKAKLSIKLTDEQGRLLDQVKRRTGKTYAEIVRECISRSTEYIRKRYLTP